MITVVFHIDLSRIVPGIACTSEQIRAIQEIQKSIEGEEGIQAGIQPNTCSFAVLRLPKNEKTLGDLIYWCGYGKFSYKTLWLNAVGEWRDGSEHGQ